MNKGARPLTRVRVREREQIRMRDKIWTLFAMFDKYVCCYLTNTHLL